MGLSQSVQIVVSSQYLMSVGEVDTQLEQQWIRIMINPILLPDSEQQRLGMGTLIVIQKLYYPT